MFSHSWDSPIHFYAGRLKTLNHNFFPKLNLNLFLFLSLSMYTRKSCESLFLHFIMPNSRAWELPRESHHHTDGETGELSPLRREKEKSEEITLIQKKSKRFALKCQKSKMWYFLALWGKNWLFTLVQEREEMKCWLTGTLLAHCCCLHSNSTLWYWLFVYSISQPRDDRRQIICLRIFFLFSMRADIAVDSNGNLGFFTDFAAAWLLGESTISADSSESFGNREWVSVWRQQQISQRRKKNRANRGKIFSNTR